MDKYEVAKQLAKDIGSDIPIKFMPKYKVNWSSILNYITNPLSIVLMYAVGIFQLVNESASGVVICIITFIMQLISIMCIE